MQGLFSKLQKKDSKKKVGDISRKLLFSDRTIKPWSVVDDAALENLREILGKLDREEKEMILV